MQATLWTHVGGLLSSLSSAYCDGDFVLAQELHLTPWEYAIAKASVFGLALLSISGFWLGLRKRFHRNGFKDEVLNTGIWLLSATTILQIANILAVPLVGQIVPCPYDTIFVALAAFLVFYALWFWHLGTKSKGTFTSFCSIVVGPFLGDLFLSTKQATEVSASYIVKSAIFGFRAVEHFL
jgi:vacuolar-type H+-ATPase subunit I/STV1